MVTQYNILFFKSSWRSLFTPLKLVVEIQLYTIRSIATPTTLTQDLIAVFA